MSRRCPGFTSNSSYCTAVPQVIGLAEDMVVDNSSSKAAAAASGGQHATGNGASTSTTAAVSPPLSDLRIASLAVLGELEPFSASLSLLLTVLSLNMRTYSIVCLLTDCPGVGSFSVACVCALDVYQHRDTQCHCALGQLPQQKHKSGVRPCCAV